jgi:hypothetical protein
MRTTLQATKRSVTTRKYNLLEIKLFNINYIIIWN